MKVRLENIDFSSNSGPNNFGKKLWDFLLSKGHSLEDLNPDVQLSFIESRRAFDKRVLRLDGIYFSTRSNWKKQNYFIEKSYNESAAIITQSKFDYKLITSYFGYRENIEIVSNGTPIHTIKSIQPAAVPEQFTGKIWLSASSWRPHKRLAENIRIFKRFANDNDVMLIAGQNPDVQISDNSIFYIGNLDWENLISVMKSADNFIHAAWLDHCPNVVVDAKAAGCKLYCAGAGGTSELATKGDVIFVESDWDYKPIDLYDPPTLDLTSYIPGSCSGDYSIMSSGGAYEKILLKMSGAL